MLTSRNKTITFNGHTTLIITDAASGIPENIINNGTNFKIETHNFILI